MQRIEIRTWDELSRFVRAPAPEGVAYTFRGQQDPSWPLASSLERRVLALCGGDEPGASQVYPYDGRYLDDGRSVFHDRSALEELIRRHLDAFQRAASGLRGARPQDLSEEQWWALGRHHGLVTPLLDWTEKPYIALFFALKGLGPLRGEVEPATARGPFALYRLSHTPELSGGPPDARLTVVRTPIDELGHLQQQRGLFTWVRSNRYFELRGLLDDTGRGDLLTQAVVAREVIPEVLRDLDLHGLDHRMLFPDVYGAAAHANALLDLAPLETPRGTRALPRIGCDAAPARARNPRNRSGRPKRTPG